MATYTNSSEFEHPLIQSSTYARLYTMVSSLGKIHWGELFAKHHFQFNVKLYSESISTLLHVYGIKVPSHNHIKSHTEQLLNWPCFTQLIVDVCKGPPHEIWGTGEQWNKGLKWGGTKAIWGNREHRKWRFWFWGAGEQSDLFQRNKGTDTSTPGRMLRLARRTDHLVGFVMLQPIFIFH